MLEARAKIRPIEVLAGDVDDYEMIYSSGFEFDNGLCRFTPSGWVRIGDLWHPLGYKVVTEDQRSLGLRRNPNIMTFPTGEWVNLPEEQLEPGMNDWGGIWTALRKSSIGTLRKHCRSTWGMKTRGFLTAINNPIFSNSYRIKSQGVMLLKEI